MRTIKSTLHILNFLRQWCKKPSISMLRYFAMPCLIIVSVTPVLGQYCSAEMEDVNFGNVDILNSSNLTTTATLRLTCEPPFNWWTGASEPGYFNICLAADGGKAVSIYDINPRQMCSQNNSAPCNLPLTKLDYNLHTDNSHHTIWSSPTHGGSTINDTFYVPANTNSITKEYIVHAKILAIPETAVPGNYISKFSLASTAMAFKYRKNGAPNGCGRLKSPPFWSPLDYRFPFKVQANVIKKCKIDTSPDDIDFLEVAATATNLEKSTQFKVTCTNTTPYYIGLLPSNGNPNGAGNMKSSNASNTDLVPYQLRSESGTNGKIWGNTATSTSVGNGVSDTGIGSAKRHTIYVTVASANYTPDTYSDTVQIFVRY